MLQPTNRLTLIDAMRPPAGFRIESAMAVTFTLDLRALLAAPAAFALTGPDGTVAGSDQLEPIELLHALRSHADKITVFSQVGHIALPPSRRVFAFLEGAVVPVDAPRGGIVHPKVWVLRYESREAPLNGQGHQQRLRVLVASRNLTFDTSWDTVLRLDEYPGASGVPLEPVGELFEGLIDAVVGPVDEVHRQRVNSLAATLRTATFALPDGVDDLQVHVLGLGRSGSPLPHSADRSLVISPFVSEGFFEAVHPHSIGELVAREESLDSLKPTALANVGTTYGFDDGSATDFDGAEDQLSPHDPGRPLVGLHAKVFAFEEGGRARLFVGSANASWSAFHTNVEILVELTGSTAALGIDRLCEDNDDERGLRQRFIMYRRSEAPPPGDTPVLDAARVAIARLPLEGIVESSGDEWAVTYQSEKPLPALDDVTVHCWPLASPGNRRSVAGGSAFEKCFETSLEALSGFLAFELAHVDGVKTEFVVPVTLTGVPEHRDRFLLRTLVGDAERFLRYLLAMLDEDSGHMELLDAVERASADAAGDGQGLINLPVLEKLLRTMRRDPAKLASLHPLVSDLAADDALPEGFAELWNAIFDAAIAGAAEGASVR